MSREPQPGSRDIRVDENTDENTGEDAGGSGELLLAALEPVEVGLEMQASACDEQESDRVVALGRGRQVRQATHEVQEVTTLPVDQGHAVGRPGHRGEGELDEEVVTQPRAVALLLHPGGEGVTAGRGQFVDLLVRPAGLCDVLAAHQTVLFPPSQRHIDLPHVRTPCQAPWMPTISASSIDY